MHCPFASASRRREKTQTGCRECPSKDHSARLALDFSHTCRLHKHRGCRSEGENLQPGSRVLPCLLLEDVQPPGTLEMLLIRAEGEAEDRI